MSNTVLTVNNKDVLGALREFLGRLLETECVNALLAPKALPDGKGFVQSLIRDPAMLQDVNPLAPTMPVQSARILSELSSTPFDGKIGAVLKPCEMRAAIELTKFLQVNLDNVVTIGVDCLGTYEVKDYAEIPEKDRTTAAQALIEGAKTGEVNSGSLAIRESCRICEYPTPLNADIALGLLGCDASEEILLMVGDRLKEELAEKLSLELKDGEPVGRNDLVEKVTKRRKEEREKVLGDLRKRAGSLEKLMDTFSTCVRCHNCMNVCPICYCKECVFKSQIFEHKAHQFLDWANRKGAIRMPSDTLIFHLTRLSHMGTSCVGCGMCDSACPSGLPVSSLFSLIGRELQGMFDYVPGRDPGEEPPVSVFKEEELETTTERH